ncbi:MAG TPA: ATP synthase F1 subunit delta [Candidatus Tectomicrobia bacterium]|nr:ATP synthase F1 subunit delta [Candidatus Tectomicrobia bacterium]
MKASPAVAKSYAKALFELARERNQAEAIGAELDRIAQAVSADPAGMAVLGRPWIPIATKRRVVDELGQQLELSKLGRDFLALVVTHGRGDHLEAIAAAYRDLLDAEAGRVRARVRTAMRLTDADRAALADRLGRALGGKTVIVEPVVDASLLGGFVAEIDSLVVDGSLDGQLARLRDRLARA